MQDVRFARRAKLRWLLRQIRRERGVTQRHISDELGMAQSFVSKYENGDRQLDFIEVEAVCEAMGMSLRSFCRRWDSTPDDYEGD